jgi:tRNA-dihydrouridine synthase
MKKFIRLSVRFLGEKRACRMMRSRLGWFAKGLPFSSKFRESIKMIATETEARSLSSSYIEAVRKFSEDVERVKS